MDTFTRNDLKQLIGIRANACVSLYVETHPASPEGQQPAITLKKLLAEAEDRLEARGWRTDEARELLKPVYELDANPNFWRDQSRGLALFVAPGFLRWWKLPVAFKDAVWVGPRFYVKHLMPQLETDRSYYLLAVSQHAVRFYRSNGTLLVEKEVRGLPGSMADVVELAPHERAAGARTGQPALRGGEGAVYHGQGDESAAHKNGLRKFFRAIDQALHPVLNGHRAPLVFAGVDYLFALYQEVNTYPHVLDHPIAGSPERLAPAELHRKASPLLEASWQESRTLDGERFESALGTGRVSADLEEVARVAEQGRVEAVFVADDAVAWGEHELQTGHLSVLAEERPGAEDLLNRIAVATWTHGGRVHVVPAAEIPGGIFVSAIFRYPLPTPAETFPAR